MKKLLGLVVSLLLFSISFGQQLDGKIIDTKIFGPDLSLWKLAQTEDSTYLLRGEKIIKSWSNIPESALLIEGCKNYEKLSEAYKDSQKAFEVLPTSDKKSCMRENYKTSVRLQLIESDLVHIIRGVYESTENFIFDIRNKNLYDFNYVSNFHSKLGSGILAYDSSILAGEEAFKFFDSKNLNGKILYEIDQTFRCDKSNLMVCGTNQDLNIQVTYPNVCTAEKYGAKNIKVGICDQKSNGIFWNWKKDALTWANRNGITSYSNMNDFNSSGILTREQIAKMVLNMIKSDKSLINSSPLNPNKKSGNYNCFFSDEKEIDPTLVDSVKQLCNLGIVKGAGGKFYPKGKLTTAQASTILLRSIGQSFNEQNGNWWDGYQEYMYQRQILNSLIFDLKVDDKTLITREQFLYLLTRTAQNQIYFHIKGDYY